MKIAIDTGSSVPPYEQVRMQVIEGVRSGALAVGERLPTVRALAAELGIAANTVARAYRELEHDEVIETRGRAGTFVSAHGDATERQAQLAARAFADRIRELGVDHTLALDLARAALRD
ncbi:DNA-binding transcriptional regulator YhcF (GntR family) [Diaminobutyricimonas aerilata]|uniref:DNA-binding transcriptional regulator YhcF (GntR family) n=1 Tax=Diaminobutyricimonas aerilata TaxID=1162967 RepID=A0A2M9CFE3_9MICO|nr:GntR family transcriptional regulator [Diaminobutyricimonas aerilata]PJJ70597.1 DNA-binding transcriptional regulator YhcF (GntR family) [Diaminobutyricimonas aerilata]